MKRYQIATHSKKTHTASSKAVADVESILRDRLGYETLALDIDEYDQSKWGKIKREIISLFKWISFYFRIDRNACLFMQHPLYHKQLLREQVIRALKKHKKIKYIAIVHDIDELRSEYYNEHDQKAFAFMTDVADVLIVHNEAMRQFLVDKGLEEKRLVILGLFDYLTETDGKAKNNEKKLIIAGNLDTHKVRYLKKIKNIKNIQFELFGPGFDTENCNSDNVSYQGVVPADEIPGVFDGGFGLVWDGDGIETCCGAFGNYLRYNNPHKLSLYLASGLPVVVWDEAATSGLVRHENIGLDACSIREAADKIQMITDDEYTYLQERVGIIQKRLREGYYTCHAVERAEAIISNG